MIRFHALYGVMLFACATLSSASAQDSGSQQVGPKPGFDPKQIVRLLDESPPLAADGTDDDEVYNGRPALPSEQLNAAEIEQLRDEISKCWMPPAISPSLPVRLKAYFRRDGTVASVKPVEAEASDVPRLSYERAATALQTCQPFDLPEEKYPGWREIELRFDASGRLSAGQ